MSFSCSRSRRRASTRWWVGCSAFVMSVTLAACDAEKHAPAEVDSRSDGGGLDAGIAGDAGPVGDAEVSAGDAGDAEVELGLVPQALRDAIDRAAQGGEVDL